MKPISPIKLYEYMAGGLPVVATRWRALEELNSPALLSSGRDFPELIQDALSARVQLRDEGLAFARENSWDARFGDIMRILGEAS